MSDGPYKIERDPDNINAPWLVHDPAVALDHWKSWYADEHEARVDRDKRNAAYAAGRAAREEEVKRLRKTAQALMDALDRAELELGDCGERIHSTDDEEEALRAALAEEGKPLAPTPDRGTLGA